MWIGGTLAINSLPDIFDLPEPSHEGDTILGQPYEVMKHKLDLPGMLAAGEKRQQQFIQVSRPFKYLNHQTELAAAEVIQISFSTYCRQ